MISDFKAVSENLFPASHGLGEEPETFPSHRDQTNRTRAHKAHSSQALAFEVFGAVKMRTDRGRIFHARDHVCAGTLSGATG
ncbi:hypothetical protein AMC90_PA00044 (plasmid) [Rhizobium phaseoli]|nr:hypothetical protein AMC90_PA00044 [Rhizobium phaseoli]